MIGCRRTRSDRSESYANQELVRLELGQEFPRKDNSWFHLQHTARTSTLESSLFRIGGGQPAINCKALIDTLPWVQKSGCLAASAQTPFSL